MDSTEEREYFLYCVKRSLEGKTHEATPEFMKDLERRRQERMKLKSQKK